MKVILQEELHGKGGEGDVIDVARGFANYLLIQGIAIEATKGNLKQLEQRRNNIAKREEVRIANAEALKAKLEATEVTIAAKVGDEGNLFGCWRRHRDRPSSCRDSAGHQGRRRARGARVALPRH